MPLGALPPLTNEGTEDVTESTRAQRPRKKKKARKTTEDTNNELETEENNNSSNKRNDNEVTEQGDGDAPRRRKKKKRIKSPTSEDTVDGNDSNANIENSTVPKKKKGKKVIKKDLESQLTSELPEEFEGLQDDFIEATSQPAVENPETDRSNDQLVHQKTAASKLVFVETRSGFTTSGFNQISKHPTHELKEEEIETFEAATVKASIWTQKFFHGFGVFLYGLTGGMALMQAIFVWVMIDYSKPQFIEVYDNLSIPLLCMFYFLITLCVVTTLDKWDLEKPRKGYFRTLVMCNTGMWASFMYIAGLILSCIASTYEDKIYLSKDFPNLWYSNYSLDFVKVQENSYDKVLTEVSDVHQFKNGDELDTFKYLILARTFFLVLGWVYVSVQPHTDELVENLEEMEVN